MLRNFFARIREGFRRFMWGRYGVDQLGLCLLGGAMGLSVVGWLLSVIWRGGVLVSAILNLLAYGALIYYLFRVLSRNLDARRRENRRFQNFIASLRDRDNRYYRCPHCHQTVRVPKGRGKIKISCPKCSEKFIRKS